MHFLTLNASMACLGEQMGLAMVLLAPQGPPARWCIHPHPLVLCQPRGCCSPLGSGHRGSDKAGIVAAQRGCSRAQPIVPRRSRVTKGLPQPPELSAPIPGMLRPAGGAQGGGSRGRPPSPPGALREGRRGRGGREAALPPPPGRGGRR